MALLYYLLEPGGLALGGPPATPVPGQVSGAPAAAEQAHAARALLVACVLVFLFKSSLGDSLVHHFFGGTRGGVGGREKYRRERERRQIYWEYQEETVYKEGTIIIYNVLS